MVDYDIDSIITTRRIYKVIFLVLSSIKHVYVLFFSPSRFNFLSFFQERELVDCSFHLNKDFSNKRTKFKITVAVQRETPQVINSNFL